MFVRTYAVGDHSDSQQIIAGQDAPPTASFVGGNSDSRLKCISLIRIV